MIKSRQIVQGSCYIGMVFTKRFLPYVNRSLVKGLRLAIFALGMIKKHAARANRDLGLLKPDLTEAIMTASSEVMEGLHAAGQTIVLITHEPDIAAHAAREIRLLDGRIEQDIITEKTA